MTEPVADPAAAPARTRRRVRLRAVVMVLGLAGIAIAVRQASSDLDTRLLPGWGPLALALALSVASTLAAARAWIALLGLREGGRVALGAYYASQLTKYLPAGGFVQAVGQVTLSAGPEVTVQRAASAYPVFAACSVASGLTLSSPLVAHGDLPPWARAVAALGPLSLLLVRRSVLAWAYGIVQRRIRRLPDPGTLPDQAAIDRCALWAAVSLGTFGIAYAGLLRDLEPATTAWQAAVGAVAAWSIGFLVLPLPSGLGVREAVLVAVLPGAEVGILLAASLAHRCAVLVAEVLAAGGHAARRALTAGRRRS
jgi:hypothetical protein